MELEVLSDRCLASTAEWQCAIDLEKFPLQLDAGVHLDKVQGFFPAVLDGKQTGFECFHDDATEIMNDLGAGNFPHAWRFALGFRWLGSKIDELQAAWMAAAAYAAATQGVVFDCEEGQILTPHQAREAIQAILNDLPRIETLLAEVRQKFSPKT